MSRDGMPVMANGPGNTTSIGIEVCMYQGMDEPKARQREAELNATLD